MGEAKYGYRYGLRCLIPAFPILTDEGFVHQGGHFVKMQAGSPSTKTTRYLMLAGDGDAELVGWLDVSEEVAASGAVATLDISANSVYRLPISTGVYNIKCRMKTCDLKIDATDKQGVQLNASGEDTVIVVDGDNTAGWVDVKLNPKKLGALAATNVEG